MNYTNTNHKRMKDLSDKDINSFYYSCLNTPMNIDFNGGIHKQFNDIYKMFNRLYKSEKENKVLLYHICLAIKKQGKGFIVCLNKAVYKNSRISYRKMTNLIEALVQAQYGTLFRGDSEKDGKVKYKSVFVLKEKLINLFTDKPKKIYPKDNTLKKRQDCVLVDSEDRRGIAKIKRNVKLINTFLQDFDFVFNGQFIEPILTRIFGKGLTSYGRFYFPAQNIKSKYRNAFVIDGEVCTELDYSSNHARLCAELHGVCLDKEFKPYNVNCESLVTKVPEGGDARNIYKLGMMCLLNCKGQYHKALANAWEDEYPEYEGVENSLCIIRQLREINSSYLHEITKQNAESLQYIDSCILEHIMLKLVSLGIPFLPYHDSVVVPLSARDTTKHIMYQAWEEVLGTANCCVVDVKY